MAIIGGYGGSRPVTDHWHGIETMQAAFSPSPRDRMSDPADRSALSCDGKQRGLSGSDSPLGERRIVLRQGSAAGRTGLPRLAMISGEAGQAVHSAQPSQSS